MSLNMSGEAEAEKCRLTAAAKKRNEIIESSIDNSRHAIESIGESFKFFMETMMSNVPGAIAENQQSEVFQNPIQKGMPRRIAEQAEEDAIESAISDETGIETQINLLREATAHEPQRDFRDPWTATLGMFALVSWAGTTALRGEIAKLENEISQLKREREILETENNFWIRKWQE
jgi:hypothetical protein